MPYADFIRDLLSPLRCYNLSSGFGAAEIDAEGAALDSVYDSLALLEKEAFLSSADDFGLLLFENLFPYFSKSSLAHERRNTVKALMRIDSASFTLNDIQSIISACGFNAVVSESINDCLVTIHFPGLRGIPPNFDAIQWVVSQIVPCHLEIVYDLSLLSWNSFEAKFASWNALQALYLTWDNLAAL